MSGRRGGRKFGRYRKSGQDDDLINEPPKLYPKCEIDPESIRNKKIKGEELDILRNTRMFRVKMSQSLYHMKKEDVGVPIPEIRLQSGFFPQELIAEGSKERSKRTDILLNRVIGRPTLTPVVQSGGDLEESGDYDKKNHQEDEEEGIDEFSHLMHNEDDELYGDDETTGVGGDDVDDHVI